MADNKEPVIIYEGLSFEVMKIQSLLEDNNITTFSNADIHGGFDPNIVAQILVYPQDKDKALSLINETQLMDESDSSVDEENDYSSSENIIIATEDIIEPYNIHPLSFIVFYILSFGIYNFYWFYKTWNYIRFKDNSRKVFPAFIATIFAHLFNFPLFRSIYKLADKTEDHYKYLSFILPLSILACWASLRILPIHLYFISLLSIIPYLPVVLIIRDIEKEYKRKSIIIFYELLFIIPGILIWIGYIFSFI